MYNQSQCSCPYCGEEVWVEFYPEEGTKQSMIIDCEVCCNPIQYYVVFDSEGSCSVDLQRAQ